MFQLLFPTMIWPLTSLSMASPSSTVSVPAPPNPLNTPPRLALPEKTVMTFCPSAAMRACTCALAPRPSATMAMTAPTPMMIPSIVSTVRILFRRNARNATLRITK